MDSSATPSHRVFSHNFDGKAADFDSDDSFNRMWHYNCVLSPLSGPDSLNSAAHMTSGPSRKFRKYKNCPRQESLPSTTATTQRSCDRLFRLFDENNDGEVSVDEMMRLLRKLGIEVSRSCLISLIESVDHTKDTSLNFSEFAELYQSILTNKELDNNDQEEGMQKTDARIDPDEFQDAFNVYDKDKDGYICAAELAEVLRDLGFPEGTDLQKCQTLIDSVDTDGNGLVDFEEFKAMLCDGCGI